MSLIRKESIKVEYILSKINLNSKQLKDYKEINKDPIDMGKQRYRNFKRFGVNCQCCGLKGEYFAKEKHKVLDRFWHLNLYGLKDNKEMIISTVSIGSKYNILCTDCQHSFINKRNSKNANKKEWKHYIEENNKDLINNPFEKLSELINKK